ncbi:hypothetical protein HNQ82_000151 [Anoxybacillus tengchongensis]|uniref:Uncharacterized protein n=1 Tax=Anoxybacillus tengchongensis TaxID=576944 RepID=A0A7X0D913_9BACL|nr:hypothetical protein [Anoxybacillus tengchongensis]MBB6175341.1 hypothetical protein [Anoxybacillus tengchongensis]
MSLNQISYKLGITEKANSLYHEIDRRITTPISNAIKDSFGIPTATGAGGSYVYSKYIQKASTKVAVKSTVGGGVISALMEIGVRSVNNLYNANKDIIRGYK